MNFHPNHIIRPKRLRLGDTIGIVAPAGPFEQERFDQGLAAIREMGFATRIDERIYSRTGYLAGADLQRAAQFNAMVADDDVQALMCARGGYGCLRLLDALDYAAIAARAKPFIGFSDVTALHRAIFLRCGLITFHGPMVTTLATSDEETRRAWLAALMETAAPPLDLSGARVLKPGIAQGVLTGGNLTTLCHLTGTWAGAGFKDQILIIEDVGEALYRIDRILTQMMLAGLFDGLAGLVLGTFKNCAPQKQIDALLAEVFDGWNLPIVSGAPVGHGASNWTVPLGATVRLDTSRLTLAFVEPTFEE
jgi:muramoyltetrapeptide carboxypeptidase